MDQKQKPRLQREWIDPHAFEIVEKLQKEGHETYLVGGCVRDLMAGFVPKDFDIATSAAPQQVKRRVYSSYIIGKRFRLVLVKRGAKQFEVATFRRDCRPEELEEGEVPFGDNFFGTPEEDSRRRDFTINSMFYDPLKEKLIDYCEGQRDIEAHIIRIIGQPNERLSEDPIRILRALRLAHKLKFSIEPRLRSAMVEQASDLAKSVLPRRREEFLKILRLPEPSLAFHEMHDLGILHSIAPALDAVYASPESTEIFDHYLDRIRQISVSLENPMHLYSTLILAFVRALAPRAPETPIQDSDLLAHEELLSLMRDQLGMFKYEQGSILSALQLQSKLDNIASFKKRGRRRQIGFLKKEEFLLALHLAEMDYAITPEQVQFWKQSYLSNQAEIRAYQGSPDDDSSDD